jgi:hypothetical protein
LGPVRPCNPDHTGEWAQTARSLDAAWDGCSPPLLCCLNMLIKATPRKRTRYCHLPVAKVTAVARHELRSCILIPRQCLNPWGRNSQQVNYTCDKIAIKFIWGQLYLMFIRHFCVDVIIKCQYKVIYIHSLCIRSMRWTHIQGRTKKK